MLQHGNKVANGKKKMSSDYLTDEEDGYSQAERDRISAELTELYLNKKSVSVVDILLDIQKRLAHVENLLKSKGKVAKAK